MKRKVVEHGWCLLLACVALFALCAGGARHEPENVPAPQARQLDGIPWAKNLSGGAPRVLFVANGGSASEIYELTARMDLNYDVFYTNGSRSGVFAPKTDYYHEGIRLYPGAVAQLRSLLAERWDAIAFVDCEPYILPAELHYRLVKLVTEGTGVVCFNSRRWQTGFKFPGVKTEHSDAFNRVLPLSGLTLPRYELASPRYTHIGKLAPGSYRSVVSAYTMPKVTIRHMGKGKIYSFSPGGGSYFGGPAMHPAMRQEPGDVHQAEYFYALAARLVLAACGREPTVRMMSVDVEGQTVAPNKPMTVTLDAPFSGQLELEARDLSGVLVSKSVANVNGGPESPLSVSLPNGLSAGAHWLTLRLSKGGKTVDWGASHVIVGDPNARIVDVTLPKRSVAVGAPVQVKVALEAKGKVQLQAKLRDADGRILATESVSEDGVQQATIELPTRRLRSSYATVDVTLTVVGNVVDRRQAWFASPRPWEPDLFVFTDDGGHNLFGTRRREVFREYGISTVEIGNDSAQIDARRALASGLNLSTRVWTTHCHPLTGGCISSPSYADALSAQFEQVSRELTPLGLTFFSVGDDSGVGQDLCGSHPYWVRAYIRKLSMKYKGDFQAFWRDHSKKGQPRRWGAWMYMAWQATLADIIALPLVGDEFAMMKETWREHYPDIAAFNRASGTEFTSFDAIKAEDRKRLKMVNPCVLGFRQAMAKRYGAVDVLNKQWGSELQSFDDISNKVVDVLVGKGRYGAKLDKTWYLEELFLSNMASAARGVRRVSPDIGIGMGAATLGNVIPDALTSIDSIMPYKGERDIEVIRSFPHRYCGHTIGVYGGKKVAASARENQAWEVLFTGGNFIWFWSMVTGGLEGDLSMNPGRSGIMLENIKEMQGGIARALIRATREHDGIGILHNRRAGAFGMLKRELGAVESSQVGFQHIVEDLGMQYRYTSTAEVEAGVLATDEFNVLILAYAQILTDGEIAAIKDFVARGGHVWADCRPATHHGNGTARDAGALDALFGIVQDCSTPLAVKGDMRWTQGGQERSAPGIRGDASVKAAGAIALAALGDTPMVLQQQTGRGATVMLNHSPTTYDVLLNRGAVAPLRELYLSLFEAAGVVPRFSVVDAQDRAVSGAELAVFANGPIQYLTLEKKSYQFEQYPIAASIRLGKKYHVYNTRSGESLGHVDRIPIQLSGLGCYVYALLPYGVDGVELSAPTEVRTGDDLNVKVALGTTAATGPHTVRVDVFQPDGSRLWPLNKLETVNGKTAIVVPIADNDPLGSWQVTVTDITTGKQRTKTVKVAK